MFWNLKKIPARVIALQAAYGLNVMILSGALLLDNIWLSGTSVVASLGILVFWSSSNGSRVIWCGFSPSDAFRNITVSTSGYHAHSSTEKNDGKKQSTTENDSSLSSVLGLPMPCLN